MHSVSILNQPFSRPVNRRRKLQSLASTLVLNARSGFYRSVSESLTLCSLSLSLLSNKIPTAFLVREGDRQCVCERERELRWRVRKVIDAAVWVTHRQKGTGYWQVVEQGAESMATKSTQQSTTSANSKTCPHRNVGNTLQRVYSLATVPSKETRHKRALKGQQELSVRINW